ncbi:MAG: hypothetical protein IPJ47_19250 [Anaerolineales bacterium]|nr:hypothetical protein [Anaerolineales bacterium]
MKWIITLLVILTAGYMFFDGVHALVVGDYITPTDGEYAGQLGPWAGLVASIGIDPRSTFMKVIFVVYGFSTLAVLAGFVTQQPWGRSALLVMVVLGLWYLPFGTAINIIVMMLLFLKRNG